MNKNYFIVKKEFDTSYEILFKNDNDEYLFSLKKQIFRTNNPRNIFPIFTPSSQELTLKKGDMFQLHSLETQFGIKTDDDNNSSIFLSNNYEMSKHEKIGEIFHIIKNINDSNIEGLSFNESDLKTLMFLEQKSKEPEEAVILSYEDDNENIKTVVLFKTGLGTFHDDDLDSSLKMEKTGIFHIKDIKYNLTYSSHEAFYPDDVEIQSNDDEIDLTTASKIMNISEKQLIEKIIEEYPFKFEGDVMDNLNQFSKDKSNNFSP